MNNSKIYLFDLYLDELKQIIIKLDAEPYRANQIYNYIYNKYAASFNEMNLLPKLLIDKLNENLEFSRLNPLIDLHSSDKFTRKILFKLKDNSQIETVLMKYDKRNTVCISTQAGCALGCVFCATGQAGLQRNITAGEIIEQVVFFQKELYKQNKKLTNIVYMGMGEPFANYNEVSKSIKILTDKNGLNFGARRITLSTVGLVPQIEKFAEEHPQVNLAISLHAADDELRNSLLPINKRYPIKELISACKKYISITNRRISFEWALIDCINDTASQASKLANLLSGMLCHVNLIPLNPTSGFQEKESNHKKFKQFRNILSKAGIPNTLRIRRGIDINAGCGQLKHAFNNN
jgi:23S rRNA (adenine2503-C2)-methyltransferase